MKKYMALLLVLALLICTFAGCGKTENNTPAEPESSSDSDTQENTSTGDVDYSNVKIGMILDMTATDGGWDQAQAESLQRSKEELNLSDDQIIQVENVPEASAELDATIVKLINEGCNLIISQASGYVVNVETLASQYPDVYFAQFEDGTGENIAPYTIWDIEGIFMCGYAAGLMSDTDDFGFVGSQPQASVVRAANAWAAGAKAARPNAKVQLMWVNSWYDPAAEKECATSLLQSGVKCMGMHGSSPAVPQACAELGGYCTGFHVDMHDYAPDALLTSMMWNWTPIFNEIITQVATNSWTNDVKYAGMAEGAAALAPWNTDIMPQDVVDKCNEMYDKIVSGEYTVLAGPISDNQGNEILAEGETFDLEELTNMYFLLDNIIGEIP